jgi:hypothetical protein
MASTASSRASFISSVRGMAALGFDGIDIQWNYPGSPAKTIWVDSGFGSYNQVTDAGGGASDIDNLVNLLVELRSSLGSNFIVTLSVGRQAVWAAALSRLDAYVDVFLVHAYVHPLAHPSTHPPIHPSTHPPTYPPFVSKTVTSSWQSSCFSDWTHTYLR